MSLLGTLHAMAAAQPSQPLGQRIAGSAFFGVCAIGAFGLFAFLAYETIAIATGAIPTISYIVGNWTAQNPIWTAVITMVIGFVIGALVVHFTGWKPG